MLSELVYQLFPNHSQKKKKIKKLLCKFKLIYAQTKSKKLEMLD